MLRQDALVGEHARRRDEDDVTLSQLECQNGVTSSEASEHLHVCVVSEVSPHQARRATHRDAPEVGQGTFVRDRPVHRLTVRTGREIPRVELLALGLLQPRGVGIRRLGIGAAWFEEEHVGLGVDFPPLAVRFEMLSEALEILRAMFRDERPTFEGEHYRVESAINSPAPLQDGGVPIMVGGSGEKKTLPMGASTADAINLSAGRSELSRKVDVINSALGTAGRSRDEINVSWLCTLVLGDDGADAEQRLRDMVSSRGMDPSMLDDESVRPMVLDRIIVGDADSAVTQLRDAASAGLDGIIVNLPADGGSTDAVRSAAEVVLAAVPDPA